jgi:hypothetical protein
MTIYAILIISKNVYRYNLNESSVTKLFEKNLEMKIRGLFIETQNLKYLIMYLVDGTILKVDSHHGTSEAIGICHGINSTNCQQIVLPNGNIYIGDQGGISLFNGNSLNIVVNMSINYNDFVPIDNDILFVGKENGQSNSKLFRYDGTTVTNLCSVANCLHISIMYKVGQKVFFLTSPTEGNAQNYAQLWVTSGSPDSTIMLFDYESDGSFFYISVTSTTSEEFFYIPLNRYGDSFRYYLYVSDGTVAGTRKLCDLPTDLDDISIAFQSAVDNAIYFTGAKESIPQYARLFKIVPDTCQITLIDTLCDGCYYYNLEIVESGTSLYYTQFDSNDNVFLVRNSHNVSVSSDSSRVTIMFWWTALIILVMII